MINTGTVISLLGTINTVHDFYKKVSTVIQGDKAEQYLRQILNQIGDVKLHAERLSDKILYISNLQGVSDITKNRQQIIYDMRDIRESLEPTQRALQQNIISSVVIATPEKMKHQLIKDPWEVLFDIQPVNVSTCPSDKNLIPVLFEYNNINYLG